jgi:hypothetical protein
MIAHRARRQFDRLAARQPLIPGTARRERRTERRQRESGLDDPVGPAPQPAEEFAVQRGVDRPHFLGREHLELALLGVGQLDCLAHHREFRLGGGDGQ